MAQEAPLPLGIIQVPVTNLYFNQDIRGRQYSKIQVQHLETLFNKTAIDHEDHRHWIDGYVDRSDVASILRALGGLTALQQSNAIGMYPFLGDQQVAYTHGRHRVEASRRIDAESCWTIFLSSTDLSSLATNQVVQRRTEQFQHEAPYTNGYIYVKLRQYPVGSRDYNEWYMRLSPNKRKNFQVINSHPDVSEALSRLVGFPGIIDALYLANVCKYSAWGLLNEFQTCLNHIYNEWSHYTRGNSVAQRDITPETVKLLEGRAPNINPSDREWVRAVFQTRMVFPTIKDQKQRDELQKSILGRPGVIPSLRSCQANMLYMGIAAQIVRTLLIPKDLKLKRTVKAEDGVATLRSVLRKCWIETEPYVEVREGEFQAVLGGPNFDLAYNTVIIAALRQFAYMSQDRPKIEAGDAAFRLSTDDTLSCEALFHRRAKLLGFRSSLIEQGAMNPALPFQPEKLALDFDEEAFLSRAERRWGRPSARVFAIIQEVAFLPRLLGTEACAGNRTAVVLFRDLVQSFLSPVSFDIDVSRPSINVNHTDPQARLQLLYTSRQASAPTSPERTVNMDHDGYGCNAESIEMDIDTPLASPQAFVRGDEDVVMSDLSEPARSEVTEGSHFWEQLILEYQSLISASNGSASPFSDASTLVLDDLGESEDPRKDLTMCNNSSPISLPSYSMVADQSRTLFNDSTANSRADGSSLWSSSGSERCSRHEPAHDGTRHLADHVIRKVSTPIAFCSKGITGRIRGPRCVWDYRKAFWQSLDFDELLHRTSSEVDLAVTESPPYLYPSA
ncbi:hypothetical protein FPRO03_03451 [Fusarium proliferatum]|nr:hypothetical protein FPRO03_03451 [Fusarium proliferatum]